jgi:hypothetical protein
MARNAINLINGRYRRFFNHDGHRLNFRFGTDLHWQCGVEQFTFSYGSFEHRWLNATLADAGQSATLIASAVLYDAPSDLLWAAVQLLESAPIIRVQWFDEPGEYRWRLERTGASATVRVWHFEHADRRLTDEEGALVFTSICGVLRFARQVRAATQAVLDRYGREEYRRRWRWDFPGRAHHRLGELIRSTGVAL